MFNFPRLRCDGAVVAFTGRERTAAEFATLFDRAGLRLERVIPTDSVMSIAEGTRA